jgi:hypothetical protein
MMKMTTMLKIDKAPSDLGIDLLAGDRTARLCDTRCADEGRTFPSLARPEQARGQKEQAQLRMRRKRMKL